ncbi:MAG: glycerate kinase [Solobacterium sp.]|nr:glycerate kinase [Solobacterium sp.]
MNKILICPDSFKGTLTAIEVADIIAEEIKKSFPSCVIKKMPIADGGEGSLETIVSTIPSRIVSFEAERADQVVGTSKYAITDTGTAIIELAEICGITKQVVLNPLTSNTYGFGQAIKDAFEKGIRNFILCIGGSASTDAGCGMASVLGAKFYDGKEQEIRPCGANLTQIKKVDLSDLHPAIKESKFIVMCDVKNPLYGENGAAYVYGPQKGASKEDILLLDEGLKNFNTIAKQMGNQDFSKEEGSGAAGGLGAGCIFFLNAKLQSGIETILKLNQFDEVVKDVDLIITGEGKVDSQSLSGKVMSGILNHAKGKKVIVLCGKNDLDQKEAQKHHLEIYELSEGVSQQEAIANPRYYLIATLLRLMEDYKKKVAQSLVKES